MKPIKVTQIVNVDKENYYLNNLIDNTDPNEVDYSFITFTWADCDFVREIEKRGKNIHVLDAMSRKSYPLAYRKIGEILKKEKTDIVHTHIFDPTLIGLTVAKRQKRKSIFTRHHSDALHQLTPAAKRLFYLRLEKYINKTADHIIAPSKMVRDILVETENVPKSKVSLIPYGQTTERFNTVTAEKIEKVRDELNMKDNLSLVFTSRLFHRKGHPDLFEAFSNLVKKGLDANLYLVGDGDYQPELEKLASNLNIKEQVNFVGWRDDALTIIAASDIVVHPSLEDALSSAIIESLMLEKPIIATDISGVRDSLDNGKYGEIVPPADSKSFEKALQKTIENLDLANQKAKEGRKYILEYMDAARVSNEYQKLYEKVLGLS